MTTYLNKETYEKLVGKSIDIKTNKYHNKLTFVGNEIFDSKKEADKFYALKIAENAGIIHDLKRQVKYELQPSFKLNGKTIRAINYYADFTYIDKDNKLHVIDVKGMKTEVYKLKKKLMAYKYGIEIEEI